MSLDNPWAKHRQSFWAEHAGNPRLPLWIRVSALAYGTHRRNGHAPFKTGEMAIVLTTVNTLTGEVYTPQPPNISKAIRTAMEYGFLAQGSGLRCLVVPPHAISGGLLGTERERCRHHITASSGTPPLSLSDKELANPYHSVTRALSLSDKGQRPDLHERELSLDSSQPAPHEGDHLRVVNGTLQRVAKSAGVHP